MSTVESRPVPTQPGLSDADNEAHALSTYVRRVVEPELVDLPPLPPSGTPARRRVVAQRRW